MITANTLSADALPAGSAPANDGGGTPPEGKLDGTPPQGSFAQVIGETMDRTMGDDGSSASPAPQPPQREKQDKKDQDAAAAVAQMGLPVDSPQPVTGAKETSPSGSQAPLPQADHPVVVAIATLPSENQATLAQAVHPVAAAIGPSPTENQATLSQAVLPVAAATAALPSENQATLAQAVNPAVAGVLGSAEDVSMKKPDAPANTPVCGAAVTACSTHPAESGGEAQPKLSTHAGDKLTNVVPETAPLPGVPTDVQTPIADEHCVSAAATDPLSTLPVQPSGTGSAKQIISMRSQDKAEKSSRNAEKILPQGNSLPETGIPYAVEAPPRAVATSDHHEENAGTTSDGSQLGSLEGVTHLKTLTVESRTPTESVRPPQVEKVFAEVTERVVSFRRVGAESIDVSLRPDRGTEINLQLSLSNGQVEVAARLQRGSFELLNAHWSDLQQSLAQQGIRVGQLEPATFNQNHNHNQAASSQTAQQEAGNQRERQFERAPETLDELPLVGAVTEPLRSRTSRTSRVTATARSGWEMWA